MRQPCLIYLSTSNEARPTERSDRDRFLPIGKKASSYRGADRVPLYSCLCLSVCNIRRFYRLRELYEADFHKPGIYGSGRVWANAWGVFHHIRVRADFFVFFFFGFFFFERTRPAASARRPCLNYLSTTCVFCHKPTPPSPERLKCPSSGLVRLWQ